MVRSGGFAEQVSQHSMSFCEWVTYRSSGLSLCVTDLIAIVFSAEVPSWRFRQIAALRSSFVAQLPRFKNSVLTGAVGSEFWL
jgi:hypothetical protein